MQVFVINTPSASNAAMTRRSSSSIHGCCLSRCAPAKAGAARMGGGGNAPAPRLPRQPREALEPFDSGFTERLGIRHDVRLGHRHEVARAEIVSDLGLMLDRPLRRLAALAGPQRFFFGRELHWEPMVPV